MDLKIYHSILQQASFGYSRHEIILDEGSGRPCDFRFIEINPAFERLTGFEGSAIINKTIKELVPEIGALAFDWIGFYGRIALEGGSEEFEQFFEPFDKWYHIQVFSVEKGYFTTLVQEVTERKKAETDLQHSQELMQYVVEHANSAVAVHDRDLNYIYVSQKYLDDYKVKDRNVIGKHHYEVFPDLPQKWRDVHQRALAGEVCSADDDPYYRDDGSVEWTRWECRPWYEAEGTIGGIIVYTEVITKRKQAELEYIKTADQLKLILEHSGDGMFAVDTEGRATMVNMAAQEMLGFDESELLGKVMHEFHHHTKKDGSSYPRSSCAIYKAFKKGQVNRVVDEVFWRKNGTNFPVEYVSTPIRQNGSISGAVVSFRDISERKQVEDEKAKLNKLLFELVSAIKELSLARSEKHLHSIVAAAVRKLANAEGATFVIKDGDRCYYVEENTLNPLWKGQKFPLETCITGWSMLNNKPAIISDIYADKRIAAELYKPTFVKSLAVFPVGNDDPVAAIGSYWSTHYTPGDKEVQLLKTLADAAAITLKNIQLLEELEHRVEMRTKELQAANKELEAFSYSVSHDLRAPLRAIDGFTRILTEDHEDVLDEDGLRLCGIIRENTHKMAELIDDLLAFSRLNRYEMQPSEIDMGILANSIFHEVAEKTMRERIEFIVDDVKPALGDPTMIRQLWANLISNAVKFSSKKEKAIIKISGKEQQGFYEYCISDNGVGFDMNYINKMFGVFQRLHSSREFEGTGVGLAIVQRIVHRHGGQVRAKGEVNRGATIYFSLPLGD